LPFLRRGLLCLSLAATAAALGAGPVSANTGTGGGAVIDNGIVQLGVNDLGNLNYLPPADQQVPSEEGNRIVGLRFLRGDDAPLEATADGCTCEGWGIADAASGLTGYANDSGASNGPGLELVSFTSDAQTATSVVQTTGLSDGGVASVAAAPDDLPSLRVTQTYGPSDRTDFLYQDTVTVENTGTVPAEDLRYRRVMDWDIEPTAFEEFSTIDGTDSANLLFSSDDGFATANPLGGPSYYSTLDQCSGVDGTNTHACTGFFTDAGPDDHGALFDFGFGALDAGQSKTFVVYYGAAPDEASAVDAITAVGAEVWSFGQSSVTDGPTLGVPATFIFAFSTSSAVDTDGPSPAMTLDAPSTVGVDDSGSPQDFAVNANLRNFGRGTATDLRAQLNLPDGLTLVSGDSPAALGDLPGGASTRATWTVHPAEACEDMTYRIGGQADWTEAGRTPGLTASKTIMVHGTCGRIYGVLAGSSRFGHGPITGATVDLCPADGGPCTGSDTTDGTGRYEFDGLTPGDYRVVAHGAGDFTDPATQESGTLAVRKGGDVRQDFSWDTLARLDDDTSLGGPGLVSEGDGFPTIYWEAETTITRAACPDGTVDSSARFRMVGADGSEFLPWTAMTQKADGSFIGTIPRLYPHHGDARVEIEVTCDSTVDTPHFDVYIDPSGNVVDTDGNPIVGATVTLYRYEGAMLGYVPVPDGSAVMSPANRTNPDVTDAVGHFGWDVTAGFYVVRASKAGCHSPDDPTVDYVQTATMTIPPPVTDIVLTLDCRQPDTGNPGSGTSTSSPGLQQGPTPTATTAASGAGAGGGGGSGPAGGPANPQPQARVAVSARRARLHRGRKASVVRTRVTIDQPAKLRLKIVDRKTKRAVPLRRGSKIGGKKLRKKARSMAANLPAGSTPASLKVRSKDLRRGHRYRLRIIDATGTPTVVRNVPITSGKRSKR